MTRPAATAGLSAVAVLAALLVVEAGALAGLLLAAAVVAASAVVRMPLRWWPCALLVVTVALPASQLPLPGDLGRNGSLTPSLVVAGAWLLAELRVGGRAWRGFLTGEGSPARARVLLLAALVACWLVLSIALNGPSRVGLSWSLSFVTLSLAPLALLRAESVAPLVRTWVVTGAVLGAYAGVEAFVLGSNPAWGWLAGEGLRLDPDGSRASVSMGHPLVAGSFFVVSVLLAAAQLLRAPTRGTAVLAALNATGLVAAGARSALLGCLVGVVVLLLPTVARARGALRLRPLTAGLLVVGLAAVVVGGLAQRQAGDDAAGSTDVHARSGVTGLVIAERTDWNGHGPGSAYVVKTSTPGPGTDERRSVENAWLELYIAIGAPGCVLLGALLVLCLHRARRAQVPERAWPVAAATTGLVVTYAFYNALEGARPNAMVVLGLLIATCTAAGDLRPSHPLGAASVPARAHPAPSEPATTTPVVVP